MNDGEKEPIQEPLRRPSAFVSYVREDQELAYRLAHDLRSNGIKVWLDRERIKPGHRWEDAIRQGIQEGDFFVACFSGHYQARHSTYMDEELDLAVAELSKRPVGQTWFIPVRFTPCRIPDRNIGPSDTIESLQWMDMFDDWPTGIAKILDAIRGDGPPIELGSSDFAFLSHQLSWPLQGSVAGLDHLQWEMDKRRPAHVEPDEWHKGLDGPFRQVRACLALIGQKVQNLGTLMALFSEGVVLRRSSVDMEEELWHVFRALEHASIERRVRIEVKGFERVPRPLYVDRDHLRHLFFVLLENAEQYSLSPNSSFPDIYIDVEAHRSRKDAAVISFRNRGIPILDEDVPHLFARGYRGREARIARLGKGNGLFLAKRIVDLHGGSIEYIRPADPQVSVIQFTLPNVRPQE